MNWHVIAGSRSVLKTGILYLALTASQLRQLIQSLSEGGDADAARRAREALDQHLAQTSQP